MKPTPTLKIMRVQLALQELGDNTQRAGLRDKGLNRVGLEIFPKINRGNPGKEASINAKCVRVIEFTSAMHKSYCQ
jgi:hypothetical protein